MSPTKEILEFIRQHEGLSLMAYLDEKKNGVWTIGYGTIQYPDGVSVMRGDIITKWQAEHYMEYEADNKSKRINRLIDGIDLTQNQYDAILSLTYNIGFTAFKISTLLRKMKVNPWDENIYKYTMGEDSIPVADSCQFTRWCRDNGEIKEGLLIRRGHECDLYSKK
jgi:lysozyme